MDECVNISENSLTCVEKGSTTAPSLIPFEFSLDADNKNILINRYDYCGAKVGHGDPATNFGTV